MLLIFSVRTDIIYKPIENHEILSKFNIRGFKLYIGTGVPIFKAEGHISVKNFGNVMYTKKDKILDYYKNKFLPYNIRHYYQYNYQLEKKRSKNE